LHDACRQAFVSVCVHFAAVVLTSGEEDTFEWTEEEMEEGPEQLAVLEADTEVDSGPAWSPLFSSSNDQLKNQVREPCHMRQQLPRQFELPAGLAKDRCSSCPGAQQQRLSLCGLVAKPHASC
jgi:hypothetical protein